MFQRKYTLITECLLEFKYQCEEACNIICSHGFVSILEKMITCPMLTRMDEQIYEFVAVVSSKSKRLSDIFSTNENVFNISYLSRILMCEISEKTYSNIIKILYIYSLNITTQEEQRNIIRCFAKSLVNGPKSSFCYALNGIIILIKQNRTQTLNLIKLYEIDKIVKFLFDKYESASEESEVLEYLIYFIGIYLYHTKIFLVGIESILNLLSSQDKQLIIASSWLVSEVSRRFPSILEDYDIGQIIFHVSSIYKSSPFVTRPILAEALLQLSKHDNLTLSAIIAMLEDGLMETVVSFFQFPELREETADFLYFIITKADELCIAPRIAALFANCGGGDYLSDALNGCDADSPHIAHKISALSNKIRLYL